MERRTRFTVWAMAGALFLGAVVPAAARAFEADGQFAKGTTIVSLQAGGGAQNNVEGHRTISGISFVNFTPRLSYLPFEPFGSGWFRSALEPGVEGWFQYYFEPDTATAEGLKAALRYHFIGFGRLVPYLEVTGGAGATNLDVKEINSTFTFVLEGGAGFSYFVAPGVAVNLGYRFQHISNGNTAPPNRGFNSHSGVAGVSFFFR
ncbi:MAG TPA: acyloxyacyl hydrolase [Methylomirabilota bacterium]|jgi:opacity protein-like surface antigen|nr:acyloxyacyl hydrolase [Methylomirabilota bacterium]